MIITTKAICLSSVRYADSSLIVKVYSKDFGIISLIAKGVYGGRGKKKIALFYPLSILEITIQHHTEKKLFPLKDGQISYPLHHVIGSMEKSSIAIFISEVISKSITHEEKDERLYDFIENFSMTLNEIDHVGNIHLSFLLDFCHFFGKYPQMNQSDSCVYFDLLKGEFVSSQTMTTIPQDFSEMLFNFANSIFSERVLFPLSSFNKKMLISYLLDYYKLHLNNFKSLKSLEILQEVFRA